MTATNTPYATLTPDLILDAVDSLGFQSSGSLIALNSYENRVYQIGIEDKAPIVAKFYRPGRWTNEAIIEEHEFALELAELEVPVIAPLVINDQTLFEHGDFRFAVFPRKGGQALEVDNMAQLEQVGRFIGRIHAVGSCKTFQHRIRIDVDTYGHQAYAFLKEHDFVPPEMQHNFYAAIETALELIKAHFDRAIDLPYIRIHGDCHAGNILWDRQSLHIVDLDDCLMGPRVQDIWMLLSGSEEETKLQLKHILDGYFEFHEINLTELHLVEALRTLRMIHYVGWLARRWQDPAFPVSFPWFNTPKYWETQLNSLREQVEVLSGQD